MAKLGDKFKQVCPFCEGSILKYWGGAVNEKKEWEDNYTCRECVKTFIVVKERFAYLEGKND